MCGRYATTSTPASLNAEFGIDLANSFAELEPDFNLAPTKIAPIVVACAKGDAEPFRELMKARWGLIPGWAKDAAIGNPMINARVETVAEKPSFRKAFAKRQAPSAKRRALVPIYL